jgi:hypothetical protein
MMIGIGMPISQSRMDRMVILEWSSGLPGSQG